MSEGIYLMKETKIRYLLSHIEVITSMKNNGFNSVFCARELGTSQPNISKKIKLFEGYLGFPIFTKNTYGHFTGLTDNGLKVSEISDAIMDMIEKLKGIRKC